MRSVVAFVLLVVAVFFSCFLSFDVFLQSSPLSHVHLLDSMLFLCVCVCVGVLLVVAVILILLLLLLLLPLLPLLRFFLFLFLFLFFFFFLLFLFLLKKTSQKIKTNQKKKLGPPDPKSSPKSSNSSKRGSLNGTDCCRAPRTRLGQAGHGVQKEKTTGRMGNHRICFFFGMVFGRMFLPKHHFFKVPRFIVWDLTVCQKQEPSGSVGGFL